MALRRGSSTHSYALGIGTLILLWGCAKVIGPPEYATGDEATRAQIASYNQTVMSQMLTRAFVHRPVSERAIIERVRVRILPENVEYQSFANVLPDGTPEIVLSTGFLEAMQHSVDAYVIGNLRQQRDFHPRYASYVARLVAENTSAGTVGKRKAIQTPYQFANFSAEDYTTFTSNQEITFSRNAYGQLAMLFVVAHEVGHHVLGHFNSDLSATERELAADKWASEILVENNGTPSFGRFFLLMTAYAPDIRAPSLPLNDHPDPVVRIEALYDQARDALPRLDSTFKSVGMTQLQVRTILDEEERFVLRAVRDARAK